MYMIIAIGLLAGSPEIGQVFDTPGMTKNQCEQVLQVVAEDQSTYVRTGQLGLKYVDMSQDGIDAFIVCAEVQKL